MPEMNQKMIPVNTEPLLEALKRISIKLAMKEKRWSEMQTSRAHE